MEFLKKPGYYIGVKVMPILRRFLLASQRHGLVKGRVVLLVGTFGPQIHPKNPSKAIKANNLST